MKFIETIEHRFVNVERITMIYVHTKTNGEFALLMDCTHPVSSNHLHTVALSVHETQAEANSAERDILAYLAGGAR